ncbi:hypothetical protein CMI45_02715 [Candidatus Pacearchaeota archaeon]|nr:hypothetical protein [Candidatus Pacearchaeota archaeon]|tara:strand:- start:2236 stop:2637 length:402 start_codon:yes stop_codon:yes gene_type:complete
MNKQKSNRIYRKLGEGLPDGKIRSSERISPQVLAGHKSGLTVKLAQYSKDRNEFRGVAIPESALDRLSSQEKSQLLGMLDNLFDVDTIIINRITELLDSGAENSEIYEDSELKDFDPAKIRAHIAHYNMGTYD